MKHFLILILLISTPITVSAVACYSAGGNPALPNTNCTIDCSDPATKLNNGQQTCGYNDPPPPVNVSDNTCYAYYNNDPFFASNGVVVQNCQFYTGAPINSGLIFLIIAGISLGFFTLYKRNLNVVS